MLPGQTKTKRGEPVVVLVRPLPKNTEPLPKTVGLPPGTLLQIYSKPMPPRPGSLSAEPR